MLDVARIEFQALKLNKTNLNVIKDEGQQGHTDAQARVSILFEPKRVDYNFCR
jgi:hypothetical protein